MIFPDFSNLASKIRKVYFLTYILDKNLKSFQLSEKNFLIPTRNKLMKTE